VPAMWRGRLPRNCAVSAISSLHLAIARVCLAVVGIYRESLTPKYGKRALFLGGGLFILAYETPSSITLGEEMMMIRASQINELERLPKNFPALQERMEAVKRTNVEKPKLTSRSPLENSSAVEKDDTFFLL